jgi:hypothetical protein
MSVNVEQGRQKQEEMKKVAVRYLRVWSEEKYTNLGHLLVGRGNITQRCFSCVGYAVLNYI